MNKIGSCGWHEPKGNWPACSKPSSFLELIDFHLERLFPTMRNTLELWAILRKN